jgi:hypothetical protein
MTQPRLFADYAANPTRREREIDKLRAMRNQPTIFDLEPDTEPEACPVCAGPHDETDCPHGTAPSLIHPSPLACDQCGRTTYYCQCRNTQPTEES